MTKKTQPPDIPYFAARGGLTFRSSASAYSLATDPVNYISESCYNTATVNHHVVLGLEKIFADVDGFRTKCQLKNVKPDRKLILSKFPKLNFLAELPSGDPGAAAGKAYKEIIKTWPELADYPPKNISRPGRPKDALREVREKAVAQADKQGVDPVSYMNSRSIHTPHSWQKKGCPKSYPEAFHDPRWRACIQKQFSDLRRTSS